MCVRHGGLPVPHFHPSLSPLVSQHLPGDSALSTVSSMSPESFVSGVVRAHLCARACAWGTRVLSRFRAVGRWRLACFYSLCVSPCLFFIPSSSSSHSAINPNSHLSDQREGWSFSLLTHLQFARRWDAPVSRDQRARPTPLGSLQPGLPSRRAVLSVDQAGRRAGPGWVGRPPCPACSCCSGP